MMNDECLSS